MKLPSSVSSGVRHCGEQQTRQSGEQSLEWLVQRTTPLLLKRRSRRYVYVCVVLVILGGGEGPLTRCLLLVRRGLLMKQSSMQAHKQAWLQRQATTTPTTKGSETGRMAAATQPTHQPNTNAPNRQVHWVQPLSMVHSRHTQHSHHCLSDTSSHTETTPPDGFRAGTTGDFAARYKLLAGASGPTTACTDHSCTVCVCIWGVVCVLAPHLLQGCLCASFNSHASPKQAQRGG